MAISSDVAAFADNGMSVAVFFYTIDDGARAMQMPWPCDSVAVKQGGFAARFVRGLISQLPPSVERYYHRDASKALLKSIRKFRPKMIVVDDLTLGGWIPLIRGVSNAKVILRTHNVMTDVRAEQSAQTSPMLKVPVWLDARRYAAFEKKCVQQADAHWAITQADQLRLKLLYPHPCSSHLPVAVDLERYARVAEVPSSQHDFVHVGTIDYRRKRDLSAFVRRFWSRASQADPSLTLHLAGKIHGRVAVPGSVHLMGCVADDVEVYRMGRFALNFQASTGGIKLKSLTSLAAGRTLLSLAAGIEGMDVTPGVHYLPLERMEDPAELGEIIGSPHRAAEIGRAGREWVVSRHSRNRVAATLRDLVAAC